LEVIPKLNHDIVVELGLYLAFEAKLNDKEIWRAVEDVTLENMHLLSIT